MWESIKKKWMEGLWIGKYVKANLPGHKFKTCTNHCEIYSV